MSSANHLDNYIPSNYGPSKLRPVTSHDWSLPTCERFLVCSSGTFLFSVELLQLLERETGMSRVVIRTNAEVQDFVIDSPDIDHVRQG